MLKFVIYGFLTAIPFAAMAEDHAHEHEHQHEGEHREHEAHQHGVANLNWVMDGDTLQVLLESPAMNIFGFEHEPYDEHDKEQVDKAMSLLNNAASVVSLTGGECTLLSVEVSNPFEEGHHEHEGEHSDVDAEYVFSCEQPAALEVIDVKLFDTFAGFEKIQSQWIINNKQGAATLSHDNHTVLFQ